MQEFDNSLPNLFDFRVKQRAYTESREDRMSTLVSAGRRFFPARASFVRYSVQVHGMRADSIPQGWSNRL
jgi:hypothetical protein